MPPIRSPYQTLGVPPTATDAQLRAAYRRLVQLHHPDHNHNSPESTRRFEQVQEAYAQILRERGQYRNIPELATESMALFAPSWEGADLRLDAAYQKCLPEFAARSRAIEPGDLPQAFALLFAPGRPL